MEVDKLVTQLVLQQLALRQISDVMVRPLLANLASTKPETPRIPRPLTTTLSVDTIDSRYLGDD